MKRKFLLLNFSLFVMCLCYINAQEEIITFNILHEPVSSSPALTEITIQAIITPGDKVAYASLNYRLEGESAYTVIFMERTDRDIFRATIPAEKAIPPAIEYFIFVMDVKGVPHVLFRDQKNPQKITLGEEIAPVAAPARGLEEEFALFAAEDVVYGAAKHVQKITEAPATVSVLTDEDIERLGILSLPELLKNIAGVEMAMVNPTFTYVGIRGFSTRGNLMLVLVDGREVNIEFLGMPLWNGLPVTIHDVKKIEIIKGPGSSLYGANAFSGVVNIITKNAKEAEGAYTDFRFGNYQTTYIFSNVGRPGEKFGARISGEYGRVNKWSKKDEPSLDGIQINARMNYDFDRDTQFLFDTGYIIGRNLLFTVLGPWDARGSFQYLKANFNRKELKTQIYWTGNTVDQMIVDAPGIPPIPEIQALIPPVRGRFDQYDVYSQYSIVSGDMNRLTLGASFRVNTYILNILPSHKESETRIGLFLQNEFKPVEDLILTVGYRYDRNSETPEAHSPRANITYTPIRNNTFRASIGRAFRKPSFFEYGLEIKDLKEALGISFANPNLTNEIMNSFELGYMGMYFDRIKASISLFYNQLRSFIDYDPAELKFKNVATDADMYGGEIELKFAIMKELELFSNFSYLRGKDRAKERPTVSVPPDEANPNYKFGTGITWSGLEHFYGSLAVYFVDGFKKEMTDPNATSIILSPVSTIFTVDPYTLLNVKIGYKIKDTFEVGVYGFNLLNQRYREFPGVIWYKDTDGDGIKDFWEAYGGEEVALKVIGFVGAKF